MIFPVLYKYDTKQRVNQWQIIVENNTFYTIEGLVDGKLTTSTPTVCFGKNIGKKNETTNEQQSLLEAKAKHQKKIEKGYNEVLTTDVNYFEPMLAKDYNKYKKYLFTVRTFIQRKSDGIRAISQNNTLTSRNGKPLVACPHLHQDLVILDGELYAHEYHDDFNKIVSLCNKKKPTEDELEESAKSIKYWVYDFPSHPGVFSDRYANLGKFITELNNPNIIRVPTYEVFSLEEIEEYHDQFLSEGFEGSIVRLDLNNYENKRSKQLLKKKDFVDEEFEIVDVLEGEGNRSNMAGKLVVRLEDGQLCKTILSGGYDLYKEIWNNTEKYIGKQVTVKYFGRTPDNMLRFPCTIKIDRNSYE